MAAPLPSDFTYDLVDGEIKAVAVRAAPAPVKLAVVQPRPHPKQRADAEDRLARLELNYRHLLNLVDVQALTIARHEEEIDALREQLAKRRGR